MREKKKAKRLEETVDTYFLSTLSLLLHLVSSIYYASIVVRYHVRH